MSEEMWIAIIGAFGPSGAIIVFCVVFGIGSHIQFKRHSRGK